MNTKQDIRLVLNYQLYFYITKYIKKYSAIGEKYVAILEDIIEKNSLEDFDNANLLPTKLKKGIAL